MKCLLQATHSDLNSYVPELKDRQCDNQSKQLCPIYCGAVINDQGHLLIQDKTLTFHSMVYPLLAIPQAARISEAFAMPIGISFGDANLICTRESITLNGDVDWSIKKCDIVCEKHDIDSDSNILASNNKAKQLFPSPLSREVAADVIKVLESFAHKTYAPATEESRLAGAGAGLSDND